MIVVGGAAHSQKSIPQQRSVLPILKMSLHSFKPNEFKQPVVSSITHKPFLSADFYSKQLGFFCRQEIKLDKITKVPFRFRLGSVEQCNWLEGKASR